MLLLHSLSYCVLCIINVSTTIISNNVPSTVISSSYQPRSHTIPGGAVARTKNTLKPMQKMARKISVRVEIRPTSRLDASTYEELGDLMPQTSEDGNFPPTKGAALLLEKEEHRYNVIFVLGPPGSGKGTQCRMLEENFEFVKHLSVGDLLREESQQQCSEFGALIDKHIWEGTIVPSAISIKLMENAMKKSDAKIFLIDGFPRNRDNFEGWQQFMGAKANVLGVLYMEAPIEEEECCCWTERLINFVHVCVRRCLRRAQGRADDNAEALRRRCATYAQQTLPIIQLFAGQALVSSVDSARPPNEVFVDVKASVSKLIKNVNNTI